MGHWINVGCGPHRAPDPWINTDITRVEGVIEPDLLVESSFPAALTAVLGRASVDRVYLGHVLEHINWNDLPRFFEELKIMLLDGAELMVVGPDVFRSLERFMCGTDSLSDVKSVLEDDLHFQEVDDDWSGARHAWNSYEARVARLLTQNGFHSVQPLPISADALEGWPVVSFVGWQCAVSARYFESHGSVPTQ